jgi:predicted nucleic acid-binding protein
MSFVVVYDACVLYPAPLRDLLLELAISELFGAKWTEMIHDEWIRSLLRSRPELEERLQNTRRLMNEAVPDSLVENFEPLIDGLQLPDANDRYVLAAAIKCNAQIIVTSNLKDFPPECLEPYGIEAMHPDEFIEHQFGLSPGTVIAAAK